MLRVHYEIDYSAAWKETASIHLFNKINETDLHSVSLHICLIKLQVRFQTNFNFFSCKVLL